LGNFREKKQIEWPGFESGTPLYVMLVEEVEMLKG
jgi:hypothetical protein